MHQTQEHSFNYSNNKNMNSKRFTLNLNDFWKGLILAALVAVLTAIKEMITIGGIVGIDWILVSNLTIISVIAYLLKQFGTNSDGKLGK